MLNDIAERLFSPPLVGRISIEPERADQWDELFPEVDIDSKRFENDRVVIEFTTDPKYKDLLFEFAGTGNIEFKR